MKKISKIAFLFFIGATAFTACKKDFFDVNEDPKAANLEQVQVEYFINSSIVGAQMDPHVAERAFVLYWKNASRQHRSNGNLALGSYDDGWNSDYYRYLSGWLKDINLAISVADQKIEAGVEKPYTGNMKQISRIWRVYLMSEFADNFGPMPIDGFQGTNPEFAELKDVYYFMLSDLKDAVANINTEIEIPQEVRQYDKAYGFDYSKWIKYGNSMRLRLAMRLSEVDPAKAQAEFEDAADEELLLLGDENFKVIEQGGWNALTAVMSREWNVQPLSATMNNLYIGLGGVTSESQLPASFHANIKPADYMGVKYENHFGTFTNDPSRGFWYDGLHHTMDPRAYKAFIIPGWFDNPDFSPYPSYAPEYALTTEKPLLEENGVDTMIMLNGAGTWNATCLGNWGTKSSLNPAATYPGMVPRMSHAFRTGTNYRIFFGNWETYFLLAEAATRGWATPLSAKDAYEKGIEASFQYWGVETYLNQYLASQSYNRAGTSVSWDHTAEPPATVSMNYVDGYTNQNGVYEFKYPDNHLYQNGSVKNDHLTKIITQKYIAQFPYLPLEAWNDQRRLGLPFFENPSVELPITTLPNLTQSTCMQSKVSFFPQRLKYPSGLQNSNPQGYQQAVEFLGGSDEVLTPLWWAKKQP